MAPLPLDVLQALIDALVSQGLFGTLATVTACDRALFTFGIPRLYGTVHLTHGNASRVFAGLLLPDLPPATLPPPTGALWPDQPLPLRAEAAPPPRSDSTYPSQISHQRKMHCLSYTKQLVIGTIPSHGVSNQLKVIQRVPGQYSLFPNVQLAHLTSRCVWMLADWHNAHSTPDSLATHPFTAFLMSSIRPVRVIVDYPTFNPRRRHEWWHARFGPHELFPTAEQEQQRKNSLQSWWRTFVRRGISRPFLGILLRIKPEVVVLRNIVGSRGMAVPGARTIALHAKCQCRQHGKDDPRHCPDHVTLAERVKNVVDMCIKAEGMSTEQFKCTVELTGLELAVDEQQRTMHKAIKDALSDKGIGKKVTVKFV